MKQPILLPFTPLLAPSWDMAPCPPIRIPPYIWVLAAGIKGVRAFPKI